MTLYRLNTMRRGDAEFCFLHNYPDGMGMKTYKICQGLPVAPDEYPADAKIFMSDSESGMIVPDLVGNTCNILIVSKRVKEAFEQVNKGPVQYLPVAIFNHKKRVASPDHFIVNPLGSWDVLDTKASEIEYLNDQVVAVKTYVADPAKTAAAPDLLRVKENPEAYVISQKILDHLRSSLVPKPTNVGLFSMTPATS